jgi:hypothetical protein
MAGTDAIYNWRGLTDRITTSGQPTEPQLADIQALGVTHIGNLGLHSHEKALPDEAASVGWLGMTYIHIPVKKARDPVVGQCTSTGTSFNSAISLFADRGLRLEILCGWAAAGGSVN